MRRLKRRFSHVYGMRHISLGNYIIICSKSFDSNRVSTEISEKSLFDGGERIRSAYASMR